MKQGENFRITGQERSTLMWALSLAREQYRIRAEEWQQRPFGLAVRKELRESMVRSISTHAENCTKLIRRLGGDELED